MIATAACPETALSLHAGEVRRFEDARAAVFRVTRGRVWVTMENDPRDIVIEPGGEWEVDRDGVTLVQAQSDASVRIAADRVRPKLFARLRALAARYPRRTPRFVPYL